jgi:hypothetical protein
MSDHSRDTTHRHPADERSTDQTTQSASGLGKRRPRRGAEDVLNRNAPARYDTPRQYEDHTPDEQRDDR